MTRDGYNMNVETDSNLEKYHFSLPTIKYSIRNERTLLKAVLLSRIHHLVSELFNRSIQPNINNNVSMESYIMDSKILQLLIQGIVDTGEYTLEGISFYTKIPFDVIYDTACGINSHLSVTTWTKIVDLYMQVKPEVAQVLCEKLHRVVEKKYTSISTLLNENC